MNHSQQSNDVVDPARLDVRPIPGREKHARIFQRWAELPVGAHFVLVNDHDPVPLYYQFSGQYPEAFEWEYLERGPELFRVKITRRQATDGPVPQPPMRTSCRTTVTGIADVDARGLEPPEPLMRILHRLETLPTGWALRARTDREPCHLFGAAAERGFRSECNAQPDGSWITILTRG